MRFKTRTARVGLLGGLTLSALAFVGTAHSAVMTYTDPAAFYAALPGVGPSSTLDFESQTTGVPVLSGDTLDGITFTYTIFDDPPPDTLDMIVSSGFDTTSGSNYLGTDNGDDEIFKSGDKFTMSFGGTYKAIGLFVVTTDSLIDGDFELTAGAALALNSATEEETLGDGGIVYFIGLIDDDGFTTATLESFDDVGFYEYNVDDITIAGEPAPPVGDPPPPDGDPGPTNPVPEPGTMVLFGLGVLAMGVARRRADRVSA